MTAPPRSTTRPVMGSGLLVLGALALIVGIVRFQQSDVAMCQGVLRGLATGRLSSQGAIDWAHLNAMDVNVGATYTKLSSRDEQWRYRQAFVENFSQAFKRAQGELDAFTRWRILERQGRTTVVAADYLKASKTLIFTVADLGWGRRRIGAIQWQ